MLTPYLIGGTAISIIGSGLLTMLSLETKLGTWVAYFLVVAIGTGISINHPYTAVQTILDESSVPIGNAIMQFTFSLGGALSLCIAQTIFANTLRSQVVRHVPGLPVDKVVAAGAYGLSGLANNSEETLVLLRKAYEKAIRAVFIYVLVAGGIALIFSLGFEHRNIKQVAKEREQRTQSSDPENLLKQSGTEMLRL